MTSESNWLYLQKLNTSHHVFGKLCYKSRSQDINLTPEVAPTKNHYFASFKHPYMY